MPSLEELIAATPASEPQEAQPLNMTTQTDGDVFAFIAKGLKEPFTPGNRNNYCHVYASDANRFGISENDCFGYLLQYAEKDFTATEIKQAVASAYQRTAEHGSKEYKSGTRLPGKRPQATKKSKSATVADLPTKNPYIRIGCDYYKIVFLSDRFIAKKKVLIPWKRPEIILDHGQKFLQTIPKYDSFAMEPDNKNYRAIVGNSYNLYSEFPHQPAAGSCDVSLKMLKHIFGEQFDQGVKYLQCLYQKPRQALPILALVSTQRQTGKSTFLNWLQAIFGDNMAVIQSHDLESSFNGVYANKNIIAVDETLIEKTAAAERLKNLSTAKTLTINNKFVTPYRVDFFGKIILCSNKENSLIRIDDEEVRYWIRKIERPEKDIPKIEDSLIQEIPAFLNFLDQQPPVEIKSRMMFLPDEIETPQLLLIKNESQSTLAKELFNRFVVFFENEATGSDQCFCTPTDIKERFFKYENSIGTAYIGTILKHELMMQPAAKVERYKPFADAVEKTGKPFVFNRSSYTDTPVFEDKTPY